MNASEVLDTDLLRTFLVVARQGSVTRAAQSLNRTQSAVSIQIKRLEERLGISVFRREPRGVCLTESGERLCETAERIIGDLDTALQSFRKDAIGGQIRVGIPDEYGSSVLPDILADFTKRYPAVEVFVQCGFSVDYPKAVENGDLDVAVFADACTPDQTDSLITDPTVWAASRTFHCKKGEPVPVALFDRSCYWRDMAIDALEGIGQTYKIILSSESVAGIKAAISAGLAVGVLARSTVDGNLQVLGRKHGFPPLPNSSLRLLRGEQISPAAHVMASAIENGFGRVFNTS